MEARAPSIGPQEPHPDIPIIPQPVRAETQGLCLPEETLRAAILRSGALGIEVEAYIACLIEVDLTITIIPGGHWAGYRSYKRVHRDIEDS
jgi:hypothetical protein